MMLRVPATDAGQGILFAVCGPACGTARPLMHLLVPGFKTIVP